MVSKAREDLPEPDRPVMTISRSRGRSRSMFLRLWVRAPRMRMVSIAIWQGPGWDSGGGEAGGRQGNPPAYRAARGGANARIPARPAPVPPAGTAVPTRPRAQDGGGLTVTC